MTDSKIDDARKTLHDLEEKLAATRIAQAKHVEGAKDVAFAAHTGDDLARKQLTKLESDAARLALEITGIDAAISEARRRVGAAIAADADEAEREKARHALALLDDFGRRGDALNGALEKFIREYEQLTSDFHQLDRLGYGPTTYPMIKHNMCAAVATKLQFTDLRQNFLAPDERREFSSVIEGWARNIRAKASARLSRNAPSKAA